MDVDPDDDAVALPSDVSERECSADGVRVIVTVRDGADLVVVCSVEKLARDSDKEIDVLPDGKDDGVIVVDNVREAVESGRDAV